jgi:hypothetical protein
MEAESSSKAKPQNLFEFSLSTNNQTRLLKAALIYGANASGKSNLIRALFTFINTILNKPKVTDPIRLYEPFAFDLKNSNNAIEIELVFAVGEGLTYEYKVALTQTEVISEVLSRYPLGKNSNVFTRKIDDASESNIHLGILADKYGNKEIKVFKNQFILSKFGDDEPIEELTNIFLSFKTWEVINASNENHRTGIDREINERVLSDPAFHKKLSSLVKFADTKLLGFTVFRNPKEEKQPSARITKQHHIIGHHRLYDDSIFINEEGDLPFHEESFGTQVIYTLGGRILSLLETGGVLIIDEFNSNLHPFITRLFLLMFLSPRLNPKNAQMIITSHDVTLLDSSLIRRDQVWIAEKNDQGVSELFSLQDFDGVREDTAFDKWYLAGKFGGLPSIKSVETIFDD